MRKRMERKIGILGGAFNPPHKGHLILAKKALEKFNLDKIIFIPSGIPPLKKENLAPIEDRQAMLKLLIKGRPEFDWSDYEIKKAKRGKKSYTIETIKYLKRNYPKTQFYWILGEDSLKEIIEGKWKGGSKILDLAKFVIASRPGYGLKLNKLSVRLRKKIKKILPKVEKMKLNIPISGTEIRKKIKNRVNVASLLPKGVLNYIKIKKLYYQ